MHIVLAVTATHDRFLLPAPENGRRSLAEAYHGAQGAGLLSEKLSSPILYEDRDALWSSAAMLGIACMTSIEASTPAEAWPLKPDDPSDLDWLNMSVGKQAIWRATDPLRPDSIFHCMADEYAELMKRPYLREVEDILPGFVQLCSLDCPLYPNVNPYYTAASTISDLWPISCTKESAMRYLGFLGFMRPEFRDLLRGKDARALLIFAYWYALFSDSMWFMARRARLECQAICIYLEKYHADDIEIQWMLKMPKAKCGLMPSLCL
ncbi:hypothetical protein N7454_004294 [Penicillium verhagenii]|nr:hypothetical protein N7454_004294 [Penicillium verhagenii]